jgi:hypothetical protein
MILSSESLLPIRGDVISANRSSSIVRKLDSPTEDIERELAVDPRRDTDNESPADPLRETRVYGSLHEESDVVVNVEALLTAICG